VRDTAKAVPAKSNPRKPSGHGAGMPSGRLYLAVLVAAVAAFFVVPVAQAAASAEFKANITGNGGGKVSSAGGIGAFPGYEEFGSAWQGEPPIECSYSSPGPATGVCKNEVPSEEGLSALALRAIPAPGSEFAGWTLKNVSNEPFPGVDCSSTPNCFGVVTPGPEREATAVFCTTGTAQGWGEACEVVPPHNHLTVYKTGEGTVVISPGGTECTPAKNPCLFEGIELNQLVTLTASPASGWAFSSWAGCAQHVGLTCTVGMSEAKAIKVSFIATPSLTVEKAGYGYGYGKVAATGISCDENCSKATSAIKTGNLVTVKATPAKGSEAAVFEGGTGSASGCSGASCTFTITANSSVKVKFDPKPTKTLTVKLTGPAAYKGRVTGKGKGPYGPAINCGSGCTAQTEWFFSNDEVALSAVAATGYTFAGWSLPEGSDAGTCTGTTSPCTVPTSSSKTLAAEFK
jgi:Divergent InlB B-repeat domain